MNLCENKRRETVVNFRLIKSTTCRIYHGLNGILKSSSSTIDILGVDIHTYGRWIDYQFTPEMNWSIFETDHAQPNSSLDKSNTAELKKVLSWKSTLSLSKHVYQQNGTNSIFLDYQLQFIKSYQFLRLNDEGLEENLHR